MLSAMNGLFIAGTDTDVGKTHVGCAIARAWRARGIRVGVCKPAESGVPAGGEPMDARALADAADDPRPLREICPVQLAEPLAPGVAAQRANLTIDPETLLAAIRAAARNTDRILVEGAGGLLVPYAPGFDGIDLAQRSGLPVLLVGRRGLGTINHVRLSVDALRARDIPLAGVVLSAPAEGVAAETNQAVLEKLLTPLRVRSFPDIDDLTA